ncbi:MAG: glycine/sarcosine/betaine reductase selenoprotein B family protein [Coprococcus sp.]
MCGPAFNAGRYGVACGTICAAVTGRAWNPGS